MRKIQVRATAACKRVVSFDQAHLLRRLPAVSVLALALAACSGGGGGSGGGAPARPANQPGQVTVTGTATQNQVLTANVVDGNGTPASINYQWLANGEVIAGATGASFALTQAQVGKTVSVRVSYTDAAGNIENFTSSATSPIVDVDDPAVIRFARSGIVSTDFAGAHDNAYGIAAYPGGRTVLAGQAISAGSTYSDIGVVRYNADGTLDTGFGQGGKVAVDVNGRSDYTFANPLVLPDGKIVIGGYSYSASVQTSDFTLIRLNADGSLDASFGTGGKSTLDFLGGSDWINAIDRTPDGKIVAVGGTRLADNTVRVAIARFNANGSVDTGFGEGGMIRAALSVNGTPPSTSYANDLHILPDGRMMLSGNASMRFAVARLLPDGNLDPSYGIGGIMVTEFTGMSGEANRMAVLPDGGAVVSGMMQTGSVMVVMKFLPNGQPDPGFNPYVSPASEVNALYDLKVLGNGNIVAVGDTYIAGGTSGRGNMLMLRLLPNGLPDRSFTGSGVLRIDASYGNDYGNAVLVDASGNVLVAGGVGDTSKMAADFGLWRFNAGGTPDTGFGMTYALYVEGGAAVALAPGSVIEDPDNTTGTANYAGYHLKLQRAGTANAEDVFTGSGSLTLANGVVAVSGTGIGTYTLAGGALDITLGANANQAAVNALVGAIAYRNTNPNAAGYLGIQWQLVDAAGKTTSSVNSTLMIGNDMLTPGDPFIDFPNARPDLYGAWLNGSNGYAYQSVRPATHDVFDATFGTGVDSTDTLRSANWYTDPRTSRQIVVRMMTIAEATALFNNPNRPDAYKSGKFWTASLAGAQRHFVIDMATGAITQEADSNSYKGLFYL